MDAPSASAAPSHGEPPASNGRKPFAELGGQADPTAGAATKRPPGNPGPAKPRAADKPQGKKAKGAKAAGKENSDGKG